MAPSKVESIRGLVEVEDDSSRANTHWMPRRRDLRPQRLERLNVNLGEGRKRLDRVAQHLDRHAGANRQRRLLKPLARFWAEGVRDSQVLAVGEQDQESLALGVGPGVRLGLRQL